MFNDEVYHDRKIIDANKGIENTIDAYLELVAEVEKTYTKSEEQSKAFIDTLKGYIMRGGIIVTTPMLLAVQGKAGFSSCGVVSVDLRKEYDNLKASLYDYLLMGRGLGFALDDVDDPRETLYTLNKIFMEVEKHCSRLAGMATLRVEHPRIRDFISAKKNISFSDFRFNISIMASDEFVKKAMEAKAQNSCNEERKLMLEAAENMYHRAEPGVIFISRFEADNPTPSLKYVSVSPCAEIAMAEGEQCIFGYLNLNDFAAGNEFDYDELGKAVSIITHMLDNTIDIIEQKIGSSGVLPLKRRVGIGICGLADLFARFKMEYGSEDSIKLTSRIMSHINYSSKKESVNLAKARGAFQLFNESRYQDSSWFLRFADNELEEASRAKWEALLDDINKYGIRNASTIATPPTANSARLVDSSFSLEPFFNINDRKRLLNIMEGILVEAGIDPTDIIAHVKEHNELNNLDIDDKIKNLFKTTNQIDYQKQINVVAEAQKFIDDSISKTITLPQDTTIETIEEIIYYSFKKGLKGITVFREGCGSN